MRPFRSVSAASGFFDILAHSFDVNSPSLFVSYLITTSLKIVIVASVDDLRRLRRRASGSRRGCRRSAGRSFGGHGHRHASRWSSDDGGGPPPMLPPRTAALILGRPTHLGRDQAVAVNVELIELGPDRTWSRTPRTRSSPLGHRRPRRRGRTTPASPQANARWVTSGDTT